MIVQQLLSLKKKLKLRAMDLHTPYFDKNDVNYLEKSIRSTFVSTQAGYYIDKFRSKLADITGSKYVILLNSGSSGIYLGLRTLNVKEKDEVFLPTLNYIASANAVKSLNAIPHFIDSDIKNFGVDIKKLKSYLKKNFKFHKRKTINIKSGNVVSCLIVTHVFGMSCDMIELTKLCRNYNIKLIEDASEALGSKYNKKHLGTYGDIGILSFNGNKIITSGAGGAFMTNNYDMFKKADHLSQNAKKFHKWKYEYDDLGYNIKMPNLNAALGFAQIKRIKKYIINKKKLFNIYLEIFLNNKSIEVVKPDSKLSWNCWLVTILLKSNSIKIRDKIISQLNNYKIGARPVWQLNHKIRIYKNCPKMDLSNAEHLEKNIITLPSSAHFLMGDKKK